MSEGSECDCREGGGGTEVPKRSRARAGERGPSASAGAASRGEQPHISRKMRAMLKKTGQESINIRELVQNVEAKEPEEVRDESG